MKDFSLLIGTEQKIDYTVTDSVGAAVTGATVLLTLSKPDGTIFVNAAAMADQGNGLYRYTLLAALTVGFVSSGNYYCKIVVSFGGVQKIDDESTFSMVIG
jgi:hypothetical protein